MSTSLNGFARDKDTLLEARSPLSYSRRAMLSTKAFSFPNSSTSSTVVRRPALQHERSDLLAPSEYLWYSMWTPCQSLPP